MNKDILQKAIDTYGPDKQIEMIQEELFELSNAISKFKRDPSQKNIDNLYGELADVNIMMGQADILFSKELIEYNVKVKMERLEERLEEKYILDTVCPYGHKYRRHWCTDCAHFDKCKIE